MYQHLQRQGIACTRREVREVYLRLKMLGKRAPPRARTTDSRHEHERYPNIVKDLEIKRPDQVWVADTLELRVASRRAFLALIEDVYTRRVVGLAISFANNTFLTLEALDKALLDGQPEIHHSDQGNTYASNNYTQALLGQGVVISMAAVGCAWENGYAERLNRTFKEEEILRSEYQSLGEARRAITAYAKLYNEQRIHMSLRYRTPQEVHIAYAPEPEAGE
jgi:putative transposase